MLSAYMSGYQQGSWKCELESRQQDSNLHVIKRLTWNDYSNQVHYPNDPLALKKVKQSSVRFWSRFGYKHSLNAFELS